MGVGKCTGTLCHKTRCIGIFHGVRKTPFLLYLNFCHSCGWVFDVLLSKFCCKGCVIILIFTLRFFYYILPQSVSKLQMVVCSENYTLSFHITFAEILAYDCNK